MDYKEKYEHALEVAQRFYNNSVAITKKGFEDIFPELAESKDEKIRKEIMELVMQPTWKTEKEFHRRNELCTWLEKHKYTEDDLDKAYKCADEVQYRRGYEDAKKEIEKQSEQNQKHLELKAGHWYICHRAYCCRADHLTVKEGERFMCEKDGVVKGFVIKEPEKYFKEVCAPTPIEDEQKSKVDQYSLPVSEDSSLPTFNESIYHPCTEKAHGQKPSEWSEEDEVEIKRVVGLLEGWLSTFKETCYAEDCKCGIAWLKSLRPQNKWKPSDEQMEALLYEVNAWDEDSVNGQNLKSLYQDLKKLREE